MKTSEISALFLPKTEFWTGTKFAYICSGRVNGRKVKRDLVEKIKTLPPYFNIRRSANDKK